MSLILPTRRAEARACGHDDLDPLGSDGDAEFFRCLGCGTIIVAQAGQRWVLRGPHGGPERQDFTF